MYTFYAWNATRVFWETVAIRERNRGNERKTHTHTLNNDSSVLVSVSVSVCGSICLCFRRSEHIYTTGARCNDKHQPTILADGVCAGFGMRLCRRSWCARYIADIEIVGAKREMKNPNNSWSRRRCASMWPAIQSVLPILSFNRKLLFGVFPCFMSIEKIFDLMANSLSISTCERINKVRARNYGYGGDSI